MKYSLLYKVEEETEHNPHSMSSLIYDLSVDKIANEFCDSKLKADYFINVLKKPLLNTDNIEYRKELIADFEKNPKLLGELKLLLNHYDNVINDWQGMKPTANYSGMRGNYSAMSEHAFSSLQVAITFTRTIESYFGFIKETLSKYDIASTALISVLNRCDEILSSEGTKKINEICEQFSEPLLENYKFEINGDFDGMLRLSSCEISSVMLTEKRKKGVFSKLFFKKTEDDGSIDLGNAFEDEAMFVLSKGLMKLYDLLNGTISELYNEFYGMSRELMFYESVLAYNEYLKRSGMKTCFPKLLDKDKDCFIAKNLKDVFLLGEINDALLIAGNDVNIGNTHDGLLLCGTNSSGKTSYIRAIGIAQIFAQSGLSVCADSAEISLRPAIFSHFSSAEKEFKEGDVAGRFEGEVQEIAEIVNNLKPHSMVLLNESFQTTVYDEGTAGIYGILKYLPKLKTQYFFVTRLTKLFDMADKDKVYLCETDDTYRVKEFRR